MLFARSPDECHLYMELHPCQCGEDAFDWSAHALEQRDGTLVPVYVSVYEGTCARCGTARRFEFRVTGDHPPPPAYGGDTPSSIVDPGEFLASSQRAAAAVPAHPARLGPDRLADAYDAIEVAVAGIVEVLKFVPDGADAVPETAFTSDVGRRMYVGDPARFRRDRLALELAELERIRSAYASALGD
jgi:hypothetical protein